MTELEHDSGAGTVVAAFEECLVDDEDESVPEETSTAVPDEASGVVLGRVVRRVVTVFELEMLVFEIAEYVAGTLTLGAVTDALLEAFEVRDYKVADEAIVAVAAAAVVTCLTAVEEDTAPDTGHIAVGVYTGIGRDVPKPSLAQAGLVGLA